MRVVVTGSSGFLGSALVVRLRAEGHEVVRLVRPGAPPAPDTAVWDPEGGRLDPERLKPAEAVVHLAGAGVGAHRWSAAYKQAILRSRSEGTRLLANALAGLAHPPSVLVTASATGIYGDRGDEWLTEDSQPGEGFRAMVCQAWEQAVQPAANAGIRVVPLRFGIVLGLDGGLLPLLVRPARLGLGVRLGDGSQFMSWISRADALAAVLWALNDKGVEGAVNATSPHPVTNAEFARSLAELLHRPSIGFAPRWALTVLAGGERAREVLLASQRAVPARLLERGFGFAMPELPAALHAAVTNRGALLSG